MKELKPLAGVTGPLGVSRKNQKVGDMQTTVGGKSFVFEQRAVLFSDLKPDTTNPRYAMLVKDGAVTVEKMLSKLRSEVQHKFIRDSILHNKGLIDPIYVREGQDGKKTVMEGNRRWAALTDLNEDDKDGLFKYVSAYIIPADMTNADWLKYLGILHEHGKLRWPGYSGAVYAKNMLQAGIPLEEIAADIGSTVSNVKRSIKTSDMVDEYAAYAKDNDEQPQNQYARLYEVAPMKLADTKKGRKAAYHVLMTGQASSAKEIRILRDIHRDDPASFAKLAAGEITLVEASGKAGEKDEVGGSAKRYKQMRTGIEAKYAKYKKTLIKNEEARKEYDLLLKVMIALGEAVKVELEPVADDDE